MGPGIWINLQKNYEMRIAVQGIGDALQKTSSASRQSKALNDMHP